MQIIQGTTDFMLPQQSVVAIGKFDGIHLGHQKLFAKVLEQKEKGLLAVAFSFDPPPRAFFGGEDVQELMTREEKRTAFVQMGIDVLIEFPLNKETAATEPERFVEEYIVGKLRASVIAAGTDLSFGSKGAGNTALLESLSGTYGYRVEVIDKVRMDGEEVSSTAIRDAIGRGDMQKAAAFLGSSYQVSGVVSHGRQIGRQLGMPTVNLLPPGEKLLPPNGVYYSRVWMDGVCYPSISNIGYKPTVSATKVIGVETYLYGFREDAYDRQITVDLLLFKRAEQKFDSIEHLKAQMKKDIEEGAIFHGIK